ncbi:MAG: zinc dependent phospholipase C family protein [Phycisphaerales bacterium]|nr:zinc dependent phospholipase C family protein [Phycisphaerales bacterium]
MLKWKWVLGVAAAALLLSPQSLLAWGPATHVKLASDLLDQLGLLPAITAALLRRNARDYLFGNIAADVVIAKKLSRVKQFCHHWQTGLTLYRDAATDRGRAFALGYLTHLAADTVAHNKFLPRQIALHRTTISFGHMYWEMRADSTIGPFYWNKLHLLLQEMFEEHRQSLSVYLTDTFLPFAVNWRMFYRTNRFMSRHFLRKAMERWYDRSRWTLSDQLMREYRAECLHRMLDVLTNLEHASVLHEDPNGNAALAYTRVQRRMLRRLANAGLIAPHILYETAVAHAPIAFASGKPVDTGSMALTERR